MSGNLLRTITILFAVIAVAACAAGGGEGGFEGPEGAHAEGGEGGFGGMEGLQGEGRDGSGSRRARFVSSGVSRGVYQSIELRPDESFAGLLSDTEVAVYYNPTLDSFIGRVRNEAMEAVCDVRVSIVLDGYQTVNSGYSGQPFVLDGLARFQRNEFEFPTPTTTFDRWAIETETYTCSIAPAAIAGGGEGGEGGEDSGGSEHGGSGGEHGGSGEGSGEGSREGNEGSEGGDEAGDEASPPILINQPYSGRIRNQQFSFSYDAVHGAFRGTVTNPTTDWICDSRTEIHLGSGGGVIELGPTIPVNLRPEATIKIVMSAGGYALDTYTLHPESTPCE